MECKGDGECEGYDQGLETSAENWGRYGGRGARFDRVLAPVLKVDTQTWTGGMCLDLRGTVGAE